MSTKSSSHSLLLKRKIQASGSTPMQQFKSQRQMNLSEDDIIRSRLLFEGDQGSDDRRISTLVKTLNKSITDLSTIEIEKLFSTLHSIEHSHHLSKFTLQMDEREQVCYAIKSEQLNKQLKELREELNHNEERLIAAKQRRLNLLEYDQCTEMIDKLGTRKELRAQQTSTLERKGYFEHLQQTFEATYQQRLKQIAIYMRPIFELNEILQEDAHEDGLNESSMEQQTTPSIMDLERPRTYSDSSIASIDGDENTSIGHSKKQLTKNLLGINTFSTALTNNAAQPLFANEMELYGTQLVNPLWFWSSPPCN